MAGRIVYTIVTLIIIFYLFWLSIFFFVHEAIRTNIESINYGVADVASTTGEISKDLYDYLKNNISRFGSFSINLKLERQIKPGIYDIYYRNDEIIGKELKVGDKLTICIEALEETVFEKLLGMTVSSNAASSNSTFMIRSIKTAYIAKSSVKNVKGYDVIADIADKLDDMLKLENPLAILVITKLNTSGKYYGTCINEKVNNDNPYYGDDYDESSNVGINRIFDNGDFIKEIEYYLSGDLKLIRYIQI